MNIRTLSAIAGAVVVAGLGGGAAAGVIYNNGPYNGTVDAWTINQGFEVADSFNATSGSTATGVDFVTWNFPGDVLSSVGWEITNGNPLDGNPFTVIGSGTAAVTATDIGNNIFGFDLQTDSFSIGSVSLTGGDYWLMLSNASVPSGDPIYWDQNNGPSQAWESSVGNLADYSGGGSETFEVLGASVPEPATWALMLMGFAGLGAGLRARRDGLAGAV